MLLAAPFAGYGLLYTAAPRQFPAQRMAATSAAPGGSCSSGGLSESLARAKTSWQMLQAMADVEAEGEGRPLTDRAAALLVDTALDRMRPWVTPAERYDSLPPTGSLDALNALLREDAMYITSFLGEDAEMTAVHEAFWQGELYLQNLTMQAGEVRRVVPPGDVPDLEDGAGTTDLEVEDEEESTPPGTYLDETTDTPALQEVVSKLEADVERDAPEVSGALDDSLLVARQNFITTVQFGYFLRRCQQRLGLERALRGSAAGSLQQLLAKLPPHDVVELTRIATMESALAVEHRATRMFGDVRELFDPRNIRKLDMTVSEATILTIDAATFGAALFDAEEAASHSYNLHFTAYGSRNPRF